MKNIVASLFLTVISFGAFAAGHTVVVNIYTAASCNGFCDGTATATISGGIGPFGVQWDDINNQTTLFATNLCYGIYQVTVTDSSDMSVNSASVIINEPTALAVGISWTNPTSCGACDGSTSAIASGGTAPYTYSWVPSGQTTANAFGLCAGTYTVSVTDANGCTAYNTVVITSPPGSSIVLDTITHINCSGSSFGTISVHAIGGWPPYSYYWNTGSTTPTITGLSGGTYSVQVYDSTGCPSTANYTVNNFANLFASVTSVSANCSSTGTATVNATGAHPPYTYLWNDPLNQTTAIATNLMGGNYSVLITDSVGCSLTASVTVDTGCYNVIKGRIYSDTNQNCLQESWEQGLNGVIVMANPGGYYGSADVNGNYTILSPNMNNTVSISAVPGHIATCPVTGSLTANFSTLGDTLLSNDFGYYQNPASFDLGIHPGWTGSSPGFTKTYWFLYWNNSATAQNALVRFVYDSVLQYTGCTAGGVHYPAQHKIEWTFPGLAPGAYFDWTSRPQAFFNVPVTVSTSAFLQTYFEILPISGDQTPSDNVLSITEPVTGSHDPNSKSVIPEGAGPNGNIYQSDSVLFYTIHFQNNGNDTAFTVVVKDTLSPFLDPATIIPGASDHAYTFDLSGQGILTFRFDNIMLPDSTVDEPGSNGYFNYTVKVRTGTPIGTVIENTAHIYFDFNEAVVTNTTVNTIVDVSTGIETSSSNNVIKVYPNPFSESTTFVIQSDKLNELYSFEMTDVLGKKVKQIKIAEKQFTISRSGLQNGIYFYSITNVDGVVGKGKVIIK